MKVRIVLAEKGLPWSERFIASWKFDHFRPAYQQLNPFSISPTLVHDGRVIIQSSVIAEYLDDSFPEPLKLKPDDPALAATMREWMNEEQEYLFKLIIVQSFNLMLKRRIEVFGFDQLVEWSKRHPDQARAQDYLTRISTRPDLDAVAAADQRFRWHMERLERALEASNGPWVCGAQFTLADVCLGPIMARIESLDRARLYADLPAVETWFQRLKMRPSYAVAVHPFEDRMWGPTKSPKDHPYVEQDRFSFGYWT